MLPKQDTPHGAAVAPVCACRVTIPINGSAAASACVRTSAVLVCTAGGAASSSLLLEAPAIACPLKNTEMTQATFAKGNKLLVPPHFSAEPLQFVSMQSWTRWIHNFWLM